MVIVNKKPPSKKVPLLIFQFPSPPTWNNWLSHLLNLYSFVINLYSSSSPLLSSNHFSMSSHFLLPSFSFSFFLSQGHMKQKNGSQRPISACFGGRKRAVLVCFGSHFGRNQTVSAPVSTRISRFWRKSGWIEKKKKRRIGTFDTVSRWVQCGCGSPRATPVLSRLWYPECVCCANVYWTLHHEYTKPI